MRYTEDDRLRGMTVGMLGCRRARRHAFPPEPHIRAFGRTVGGVVQAEELEYTCRDCGTVRIDVINLRRRERVGRPRYIPPDGYWTKREPDDDRPALTSWDALEALLARAWKMSHGTRSRS